MARKLTWGASWALLALAVVSQAQETTSPASLFSPDELTSVQEYWAKPGRYLVTYLPAPWQAVYSSAASEWIYKYYKARNKGAKVVPTINPTPANATQAKWDEWIDKRYEYDRARAEQVAADQNALPTDAANIQRTNPPIDPGPCPSDLVALAGEPPRFWEASKPHNYAIQFDDVTITYRDNVTVRRKYPYYRFNLGVNSAGLPVKRVPKDEMRDLLTDAGLTKTEANVMGAVSPLEGGFDSVNTYDTGYVSVGLLQFATLREGAGSLGAVLAEFKRRDPEGFNRDLRQMGIDVSPKGVLSVVDIYAAKEVKGHEANLQVIHDKRLVAVLQRAGQMKPFRIAQLRTARQMFYPASSQVKVNLGGTETEARVSDVVKSEAGLATLMDRKVNTGSLAPINAVLTDVAAKHKCKTVADLANFEAEVVARMKYRGDFSRASDLTQPKPVAGLNTPKVAVASRGSKRGSRTVATTSPRKVNRQKTP